MIGCVGISRWSIVTVFTCKIIGVFAHIQPTYEDGASGFQSRNQGCIFCCRRMRVVDLGTGKRGKAFDVEQVFDGKGNTGKGAGVRVCSNTEVNIIGPLQGAGCQHVSEGVERRIELFNSL